MKSRLNPNGFTLIELMVVVSILAVLAAIAIPIAGSVQRKGRMAKELSAARQLMAAYLLYPAENGGELLPGYGSFPAKDDTGAELHAPVSSRYPWRIAPYLEYDMRILWGNTSDDRLSKLREGPRESYQYGVSVQPALGVNALFVGGDYQSLSPTSSKVVSRYGQFCVTRMVQAVAPQKLIVFASAGSMSQGKKLNGYFKVEAPYATGRVWSTSYSPKAGPDSYGHVDFRWEDKAVAVMLDGHVELLDFEQMNDMRRWANQASMANNPTWALGQSEEQIPGGGGGSWGDQVPVGDHVDGNPINDKP
ncbi:MAG: type II secretion system protein [Chthoniobacteraceae bacterium]